MGPRGFIEAFDAETGKSRWRWYSIPAAGEPGSETWPADTWKIGGCAVWHAGTYDPITNLLYFGTGNPAPWIADMRKGDNLYTMSAVALDLDTGTLKWHFQYLPNDAWDYDTTANITSSTWCAMDRRTRRSFRPTSSVTSTRST